MVAYPERRPEEVGTEVPVDPEVAPETYTYDYIVVGGTSHLNTPNSRIHVPSSSKAGLRAASSLLDSPKIRT